MPKICFIRPAEAVRLTSTTTLIPTLPLGIAYVAASARAAGHEVSVIDAVGDGIDHMTEYQGVAFVGLSNEEIIERVPGDADILAVGNMFSHNWPYHRELVLKLREARPGAMIVMGGEHATSLPELTLRDGKVDLCVQGEGEETFAEIAAARRDGKDWRGIAGIAYLDESGAMVKTPRRSRIRDIDAIPPPAWDLINVEGYKVAALHNGLIKGDDIPFMPILATRGCPYQCTFCTSPNMWTTAWIARDPEKVLDEIQGYIEKYGARNFRFQDLTAITRKDWIIAFCKAIVERKLDFIWQLPSGTRSESIDDEVAGWLRKAGMVHMAYAPESGSDRIRTLVKKRVKAEALYASVEAAVKAGLNVEAFFIMGFPEETLADLRQTLKMIAKLAWRRIDDVAIQQYTPYPGSEMFQKLLAEGKAGVDDRSLLATLNIHKFVLNDRPRLNPHFSQRVQTLHYLMGYAIFHGVLLIRRPIFSLKVFAGIFLRPKHDVSIFQKVLKSLFLTQDTWIMKLHRRRLKEAKEAAAGGAAKA